MTKHFQSSFPKLVKMRYYVIWLSLCQRPVASKLLKLETRVWSSANSRIVKVKNKFDVLFKQKSADKILPISFNYNLFLWKYRLTKMMIFKERFLIFCNYYLQVTTMKSLMCISEAFTVWITKRTMENIRKRALRKANRT